MYANAEWEGSAAGPPIVVYFAPEAADAVRAYRATLLDGLRLVVARTGRAPSRWLPIAFAASPSRGCSLGDGEHPWDVEVDPAGQLTADGWRTLAGTIPHEEIHKVQESCVGKLPRWFAEGQATWAGLLVTQVLAPALAASDATARALLAQSHVGAFRLARWGGIAVKRAALLRQATPDEQAHMTADPSYTPSGPFTFGPEDTFEDLANEGARYGRTTMVFNAAELQIGRAGMNRWFDRVCHLPEPRTDAIVSAARAEGAEIEVWLQDAR